VVRSKGGFFFDEKSKVISHQYNLRIAAETNIWITIEPLCIKPGGMICLLSLRAAVIRINEYVNEFKQSAYYSVF